MNKFTLFVTPKARSYFKKHMNSEQSLHIQLKASGCSGYSTVFNIIDKQKESQVFDGLSVYLSDNDKKDLNETVIDIRVEGLNQKIIFDNPKAIHQCGCGESFALSKEKEKI